MAAPPSRSRPPAGYNPPANGVQQVGPSFLSRPMQNLQIGLAPPLSGSNPPGPRVSSPLSGAAVAPFTVEVPVPRPSPPLGPSGPPAMLSQARPPPGGRLGVAEPRGAVHGAPFTTNSPLVAGENDQQIHRTSNFQQQQPLAGSPMDTVSPAPPRAQAVGSFPVRTPGSPPPVISPSQPSSGGFLASHALSRPPATHLLTRPMTPQPLRTAVPASLPHSGPPQASQPFSSSSQPFSGNAASQPSGFPGLPTSRQFSDLSGSVPFAPQPPSRSFSALLESPSFSSTPASQQPSDTPQVLSGPPLPASPYGAAVWSSQAHQPPPRMYGMSRHPTNPASQLSNTIGQLPSSGSQGSSPLMIDPDQIPQPMPSSSAILFETTPGSLASIPPPTSSDFIVKDKGNCSPRLMRCTVNQIPCTGEIRLGSNMPLALIVQPFALSHPSEEPIQIVDFGESGPLRCSRCKGYINPFMKFIDQGRSFICNLCGCTNETPRDYYCNLGPDGRRHDADERPELCRGSVEFVATKEFMVRDPMPAVFFFLIDVSMNAVETGAAAAACSAVSQAIADLPEGPQTLVGIATFDSTIHFYNLKRNVQQPLMLIVPDVEDLYTPLHSEIIVQLPECRQRLEQLLENIPTVFEKNRIAESAFGAAIKASFLALKPTGGKLLVFQSVLPSVGIGSLAVREAEGRANVSSSNNASQRLLQPIDDTLKVMAQELAEFQVCVDIFVTTQTYIDIASISVIPRTTGGKVYQYYPFSALSDSVKLYNDLRWNITRPQGFEGVMRVRCSQGLQVQEYYGNFCKRNPVDIDLPAIDCDKSILVTFKHDGRLQEGTECSFQCALLYTTVYGQRRIRVINLSLPCTKLLSDLFRSPDLDTLFACFLKQAANGIPSSSLSKVREQMTNFCINILYSYRKFCAAVPSSGQLILPEALKLLPLYTLALIKSIGLRTEGRSDDRSYWINHAASLSIALTIPLVYPRMLAVLDLASKEHGGSIIPSPIPLSSAHITDDGIYLLENGEDALIYVGNTVNPDILQQVFGSHSIDHIPMPFTLQKYDNDLSKRLNDVVDEIRRQRSSYLRMQLCRKGDPSGALFFSYLIEEKTPEGLSYVEFLVHIHQQIQTKMA
ncbi:unnamed protein product [Spirodela intermedia]|uniref:Uncharacterized protein n=1 Tax=Spirodela intermedia TaxID=51605 RepID=A0A7I8KRR7_SPIIN|nr:unnamed protein product [Spirodela intermedia]